MKTQKSAAQQNEYEENLQLAFQGLRNDPHHKDFCFVMFILFIVVSITFITWGI